MGLPFESHSDGGPLRALSPHFFMRLGDSDVRVGRCRRDRAALSFCTCLVVVSNFRSPPELAGTCLRKRRRGVKATTDQNGTPQYPSGAIAIPMPWCIEIEAKGPHIRVSRH